MINTDENVIGKWIEGASWRRLSASDRESGVYGDNADTVSGATFSADTEIQAQTRRLEKFSLFLI